MTSPAGSSQSEDRPARVPRIRWGCLAFAVFLLVSGAAVVYGLLLAMSFRECNPSRVLEGTSDEATAVLDRAHPVVEQRVTLHIPAAGLPDAVRAGAVTLNVDRVLPRPATTPRSPAAPSGSAPASAGAGPPDIRIAFVRADTGEVVSRISSPTSASVGSGRAPVATVPLDCSAATDCDVDLRVVISLPTGAVDDAGPLAWSIRATIAWGFTDCAGPASSARPIVTAGKPTPLSLTTAELPIRSDSATVLARHVTVSTRLAPDTAWGHLFIRRSSAPWLPWLRILADGNGSPLLDAPLGPLYGASGEEIVDFPILADCEPGAPCRRGYWLVIQAMPVSGFGTDLGWSPKPGVGGIDWQLGALALRESGDGSPAPLELAVDREPPDLAPAPIFQTQTIRMDIDPQVERFVDVTLHVPADDRSAEPTGTPEPLQAAYVVANVTGFGVAHGYHLEGIGAGPFRGGANGGSAANLIAHPFDACPDVGPCDTVVRMVGVLNPDPHSSMSGIPNVTWQLDVLGAPPGTTATVGPVQERPRTDSTGGRNAWSPLVVVAAVGAALAIGGLLVRYHLRSRKGPARGSS